MAGRRALRAPRTQADRLGAGAPVLARLSSRRGGWQIVDIMAWLPKPQVRGRRRMFELKDAMALLALVVSAASFAFTLFKGRYDQITGVKPALVFVYDHSSGWQVQNIGAGPALNIIIAKKESGINAPTGRWVEPVRIPPLKKDGIFLLHWGPHNNTHGLGATYEDMWARPYTTTCGRDLNSIRRGLHLQTWDEDEIKAEWELRKA
jgi:hypothetical protein